MTKNQLILEYETPFTKVYKRIAVFSQRSLLFCALGTLGVSLANPAFTNLSFNGGSRFSLPMWLLMILSPAAYPSNLLLLLILLAGWWLPRFQTCIPQLIVLFLSLTSSTIISLGLFNRKGAGDPAIGLFLWYASHFLSTIALCVPVWRPERRGLKRGRK